METKHILILTMHRAAGESIKKTLLELFPANSIDIVVHTPSSYAEEKDLSHIDLYLISKFAISSGSDLQYSIPFGVPVVDMKGDFKEDTISDLRSIKKGTKCLLVNVNTNTCLSAIMNLLHRGIHNIDFYPYAPGMDLPEDIDFAITPGEPHLVPEAVTRVIDLGYRHLTPRTILEVALKLGIENIFEGKNYRDYSDQFPSNDYNSSTLYQKTSQLEIWLSKLMELMDTGVVGIDEYKRVFCINKKARDILNIDENKEREKDYKTILPFIDFDKGMNKQLRMTNKLVSHDNTDMMVTIHPIEIDLKFKGHFVIIDKFDEMENKQQKARLQILQKGHQAKYYFSDILSDSDKMASTCQLAKKMAKTSSAILITGESGTGKELLASAIHNESSRSAHPYIAINCAAMPENLLESELFGYEGGAFTGAKKSGKLGLFEYAHKGTIFLDEIEDMSPSLQVKLLRVLQEKEVMRVGGHKIINVDVRVIAATNMNMENLVKEGSIRKDLYYRLNTLQLELPPLRERIEDIPLLTDHFMAKKKINAQLSDNVYEAFKHHPWDGNIRELENCIEYFQCLDKDILTREDLPKSFKLGNLASDDTLNQIPKLQNAMDTDFPERPDTLTFILKTIYRFNCLNKSIGRRSLQKEAEKSFIHLSESEIRKTMSELDKKNLIEIRLGRGGARVTDEGIEYLRSLK